MKKFLAICTVLVSFALVGCGGETAKPAVKKETPKKCAQRARNPNSRWRETREVVVTSRLAERQRRAFGFEPQGEGAARRPFPFSRSLMKCSAGLKSVARG